MKLSLDSIVTIFDKAENKNWILFFDEADALFGKRTDISDAHEKYVNQEVAYLMQRIENYNGLVILATNQKDNIDDVFLRRFQAVIHFPAPDPDERERIWRKAFSHQIEIGEDINWHQVATHYELSGTGIMRVVHACVVEMQKNITHHLSFEQIKKAILQEYLKVGKEV